MPQLVFLGIFQMSAAFFYSEKMVMFLSSLYPQCTDPLLGFLVRFGQQVFPGRPLSGVAVCELTASL